MCNVSTDKRCTEISKVKFVQQGSSKKPYHPAQKEDSVIPLSVRREEGAVG